MPGKPQPYLKPCPCCADAEPIYDEIEGDRETYRWVLCGTCGLKAYSIDTDPLDPVEVWNTRPEPNTEKS